MKTPEGWITTRMEYRSGSAFHLLHEGPLPTKTLCGLRTSADALPADREAPNNTQKCGRCLRVARVAGCVPGNPVI